MADNIDRQAEGAELTAEQLDEQHRIRLEKLAALKEAGKDPYIITKYPVSIQNKEIRDRFDELERTECRFMSGATMWVRTPTLTLRSGISATLWA